MLNLQNIFDTIDMIDKQHLDIRTITMGISLLDCVSEDPKRCCEKIYDKICRRAEKLVQTGRDIESRRPSLSGRFLFWHILFPYGSLLIDTASARRP